MEFSLPKPGERNILVTSALPYVNNLPHLGNIIGSVLSADVFARFCRLRGYNVLYVCGTDEYGTTTEVRAAKEDVTPKEICDKYHPLHKELYCENCLKFLADSYVEGHCPHCHGSCKGDQCEDCSAHLNARDLIDPVCKICQSLKLQLRSTEHLFLQLATVQEDVHALSERISFSNEEAAIKTKKLVCLDNKLPPKCITRDLKWGVPVPVEKFKDKVMYVWFDAPLGYISITKCHTSDWELWWKNPQHVELHQFMGKDNVSFHSVHFPSCLIGTGENWTLPHSIHATHFLLFREGKFSKSRGVGIFGDEVKGTNIPVEVWRYYLVSIRPEASDSCFCWKDLQAKLNSELADNLGNFMNRVLTFVSKPPGKGYNFIIPDDNPDVVLNDIDIEFGNLLKKKVQEYVKFLEKGKLKDGLKTAMAIATEGNRHFQRTEVWKLYVEDRSRCSFVVKTLVGVVCILACLLEPYMPSFTSEVLKQLKLEACVFTLHDEDIERSHKPWEIAPSGHEIGKPCPLFRKLSDDDVKDLEKKICGNQTERHDNVVLINKSKVEVDITKK